MADNKDGAASAEEFAYTPPETMPESVADIEAEIVKAGEAFDKIVPEEGATDVPPEIVVEMETIASFIATATAARDSLIAEAQERISKAQTVSEQVAALRKPAEGEAAAEGDEGEDPADGGEEFAAGDEAAAEAAAAAAAAEAAKPGAGKESLSQRSRGSFRAAARRAPRPKPQTQAGASPMQFAIDSGLLRNKHETMGFAAVAEATTNLLGRTTQTAVGQNRMSVARLERPFADGQVVENDTALVAAIEAATDETNLGSPGTLNPLVAAGGWCAPSEVTYDFLGTDEPDGLLDLPEVGISRGGLRFPVEPEFGTIYTDFPGFYMTEAQAIAGQAKDCQDIPCPGTEEIRLDVTGLCLTAGILQAKAWPESIEKFVREIMAAHQHRISARSIAEMVAGSGTAIDIPATNALGAAAAYLNAVELAVRDLRAKDRIPENVTVEGVTPSWVKGVIRADLTLRNDGLPDDAADAMIDTWLGNRGVRMQWVTDWQVGGAGQLGLSTPATTWPTAAQFLLYRAGTWFRAMEPVIDLGIIHDKASLQQNVQTQMFTEDGIKVAARRTGSRLYSVPVVANGQVGLRSALGNTAAAV